MDSRIENKINTDIESLNLKDLYSIILELNEANEALKQKIKENKIEIDRLKRDLYNEESNIDA